MDDPHNCTLPANANSTYCMQLQQHDWDVAFATSLVLNTGLFVLFGALFLAFKHMRRCRTMYVQHTDVPEPARGLFGWARSALAVTDAELEVKRGLDEVMYLLVIRFLLLLTLLYGLYGLVLVPVHATAGGGLTGLGRIGLGNVPQGSAALTADLLGVFFNSIVTYFVLYALYRRYVAMRIRYRSRHFKPENYTVMVREFPRDLTDDALRSVLDVAFPGAVAHVQRAYDTDNIEKHLKRREKAGLKLEKAQAVYMKKGMRPTTRTRGPCFACGPKADAVDFFRGVYLDESACAASHAAAVMQHDQHMLGTAFVTFYSRTMAQLAAQSTLRNRDLRHPLARQWVTQLAPAPQTINWSNLGVSHVSRVARRVLVNGLALLLALFWMIPVTFASGLANLETLATVFPFAAPLLDASPALVGFIEGWLPSLALSLFFAVLASVILPQMVRLERNFRADKDDRSVFSLYYLFLVFNVFLGSVFASGVFNVMGALIENPASIVQLLATSLPGQVNYFLSYVMILSLSGFTLELWRPVSLVVRFLFLRYFTKTKRERRDANGPYFTTLHLYTALNLIVFIIVLVYSTLNPLIIPFGCIYFGLAYITGRYGIAYVYTPARQGQGAMFPSIFTRLVWSLIVYQVTLAGVLGLALFPAAVSIAALVIVSLVFWWYTDAQLHQTSINGVLVAAGPHFSADAAASEPSEFFPCDDTYLHPMLRTPLFHVENQDPAAPPAPTPLWWPIHFRSRDESVAVVTSDPPKCHEPDDEPGGQ